ncbi:MAG: hypothetical protein K0Q94_2951 [Paenibacillus sp.]|jgi:RNA polymerase sigma factor (sigma-70 family)|nr:hypothetical protein [Paenibacillus sp.]
MSDTSKADKPNDEFLVRKAREGDGEAFGELVRRHRSRMLAWADLIVRDRSGAEDIVQEALLQAMRRLDRLADPDKFVPWLRTIVRNQALMSIRGARHKRERLTGGTMDGEGGTEADSSYTYGPLYASLPDSRDSAMGRAALEQIGKLLDRLGAREREVVRIHLLAGLTVQETAERLKLSSGAIYTSLSRARRKLTEASFEEEARLYAEARRRQGRPAAYAIPGARYYGFAASYDTMASMMLVTLAAKGIRDVSLTDMMGANGQAFRIRVTGDLGLSGPYAYDWAAAVKNGWSRLGYSASVWGGPGVFLTNTERLTTAMDGLFAALESGTPVMAWNVSNPEFGILTGYDDLARSWTVTDTSAAGKKLAYAKLGRVRGDAEWFAAYPRGRIPADPAAAGAGLLVEAVRHLRGEDDEATPGNGIGGLNAYRVWLEALERQTLTDPLSAAYNSAVVAEARRHASLYMHQKVGEWGRLCPRAAAAASHAGKLYLRIAEAWSTVSAMFPLPYGADPTAPGPADRTFRLLERAKRDEKEVSGVLEEASYRLQRCAQRSE